jgi:enterochelin esterase family protein
MKFVRVSVLCALVAASCSQGSTNGRAHDGSAGNTGGAGATPPPGDAGVGRTDSSPARDSSAVEIAPPDGTPPRDAVGPVTNDARGFDSSAADPGTDGDGMRTLNEPYHVAPEYTAQAGVPRGKVFDFAMGVASTIYPKAPTTRKIGVYVPAQYKTATPAAVMVFQDGTDFYGFNTTIPTIFDNLIAKGAIPPTVAVFAGNGGGDNVGSERGLEYDTVSGLYAEWVDTELLPRVAMESTTALPAQALTFTKDPEGRGAVGGSSGGAASFSMVWWHPDLFRRVITFSGTYVNQVPAMSPFPHGCWVYHDEDPYDMTAPNGLIVAHCESAANPAAGSSNPGPCDTPLTQPACLAVAGCAWNTSVNKPIRAWLESGSNDSNAKNAPSTYRNFLLANQRMAASLQQRGYHYHFDYAIGAGHVDQGPLKQTLPEALTWVWRGYVASGM